MKIKIQNTSDEFLEKLAKKLKGTYEIRKAVKPACNFACTPNYKLSKDHEEFVEIAVSENGTWKAGSVDYEGGWSSSESYEPTMRKYAIAEKKFNEALLKMTLKCEELKTLNKIKEMSC